MALFVVIVKFSLCFLFGVTVHYFLIDLPEHSTKPPGTSEVTPSINSSPKPLFPVISKEENIRECMTIIQDFYDILESMSNMSSDGNLRIGAVYPNYMTLLNKVASIGQLRLGFPVPYEILPNNTRSGIEIPNKLLNRLVSNGNYYRPVRKRRVVVDMKKTEFQVLSESGLHLFLMATVHTRWVEIYGAQKFTESLIYMRCNQLMERDCKIRLISQMSVSE